MQKKWCKSTHRTGTSTRSSTRADINFSIWPPISSSASSAGVPENTDNDRASAGVGVFTINWPTTQKINQCWRIYHQSTNHTENQPVLAYLPLTNQPHRKSTSTDVSTTDQPTTQKINQSNCVRRNCSRDKILHFKKTLISINYYYYSISKTAPHYLSNLLQPYTPARQ